MKRGTVAVLAVVLAGCAYDGEVRDRVLPGLRVTDGTVIEGSFVDGKREGHWVIRAPDGTVAEGPYVAGNREGHWIIRFPDKSVWEGPYVAGKPSGRWVVRFPGGLPFGRESAAAAAARQEREAAEAFARIPRKRDLWWELDRSRDCRERAIGFGPERRERSSYRLFAERHFIPIICAMLGTCGWGSGARVGHFADILSELFEDPPCVRSAAKRALFRNGEFVGE